MKILIPIIIISNLFSDTSPVQIESYKLIDQMKNGNAVKYENKVFIGNLDFTELYDKHNLISEDQETIKEKIISYFIDINVSGNEIKYDVDVPVEFINCTFQGKVIGWVNDEETGASYNAVFQNETIFVKCIFIEEVLFKYSEFNGPTDFSENQYNKLVLFKYADFSEGASFEKSFFLKEANFKYTGFSGKTTFARSKFNGNANFKYTEFDDHVDFSNTIFLEEANFKYTDFSRGVSFANSIFSTLSNFKYTKFSNPLNFEGTIFNGDTDFKYTTLEGQDFSDPVSQ